MTRLAFIALVSVVALGSGCMRGANPRASMPAPASGEIIDGQKAKDRTVIKEADAIAQEWPDAKPHTDAQIAAVAAAPAEDVARLNAQWAAIVADRDAQIAKLEKKINEADAKIHKTVRLSLASAGFVFGALTIAGA